MSAMWGPGDPEPPVGTVLEVGNPGRPWKGISGDLLTFIRLTPHVWVQLHNRAPGSMRPVSLDTVRWWAPCRVITAASLDDLSDYYGPHRAGARPPVRAAA